MLDLKAVTIIATRCPLLGEVSDAGVVYLSVILVCTKTMRVGQVRNLLL